MSLRAPDFPTATVKSKKENVRSIAKQNTRSPSKPMSESGWTGIMMLAGAALAFLYAKWALP
jgi:hypothetical protein